jgi:hypothetical protein
MGEGEEGRAVSGLEGGGAQGRLASLENPSNTPWEDMVPAGLGPENRTTRTLAPPTVRQSGPGAGRGDGAHTRPGAGRGDGHVLWEDMVRLQSAEPEEARGGGAWMTGVARKAGDGLPPPTPGLVAAGVASPLPSCAPSPQTDRRGGLAPHAARGTPQSKRRRRGGWTSPRDRVFAHMCN